MRPSFKNWQFLVERGKRKIDILYLVDKLETLVQQGRRVPFTSTVMINEEDCLAIIDQMRISIPEEIRQAKRIEGERERITAQAQEEAERIISLAQDEASQLVDEHEVLDQATARASVILQNAIQEGHQIKLEAEDYVIDVLEQLDSLLTSFHNTVRNGITALLENREEDEAENLAEYEEEAPT